MTMVRTLHLRRHLFVLAFAACTLPPYREADSPDPGSAAARLAIVPAAELASPSEPVFGPLPAAVIAVAPAAPAAEVARRTSAPAPLPPVVFAIVAGGEARTVEVEVGQELVFENRDAICHSLFSRSPEHRFDVGVLLPSVRAAVRFTQPGTVQVHCALHEHRALTIQVVADRTSEPPAPR